MGIFGHINWWSPDFWTINRKCTTQNKYLLSTWLVACSMQPADSLFSFVAKNGWKNISPSAIGVWGPSRPSKVSRWSNSPIQCIGHHCCGPQQNGVVKGREKRLGKKFWCPESFGTWTKPIMNMVAFGKAFCLFKVIFYGFDPMGFITMKTHCFGECVWFTFSNHQKSICKKQNEDILCV